MTFRQSLMLSNGVTNFGNTGLTFTDPAVEVSGADYRIYSVVSLSQEL